MMPTHTRIGALLHREHQATIQTLQGLEQFLVKQTAKRRPDTTDAHVQARLRDLLDTLEREVGRHFAFEEEHLFPLLAEKGESGIGEFLAFEHSSILPLAQELAEMTRRAQAEGFTDMTWRAFHATGAELIEREIFHIQKEEMGLLSAIAAVVDPATDARLAETYVRVVG